MAQHRFNKEEAAKAGSLKGKHKKTLEWEKLSEFITETGAKRIVNYLNSITDDKEYFDKYCMLLNYFKPKIQATQIEANINSPQKITGITFTD
jgi:hypothetical protein